MTSDNAMFSLYLHIHFPHLQMYNVLKTNGYNIPATLKVDISITKNTLLKVSDMSS